MFPGMPGFQAFHSAPTKVNPHCHLFILTRQKPTVKKIILKSPNFTGHKQNQEGLRKG
ncbi:mCG148269 [Mus musculus]|nr:mCG148269 [Mus musculus]